MNWEETIARLDIQCGECGARLDAYMCTFCGTDDHLTVETALYQLVTTHKRPYKPSLRLVT